MSERRVLMLAYHFPPIAGAGVFRTLRFVKFLPQFGWKPLVLSAAPDAYTAIDESLLGSLPPEAEVRRAVVRRPRAALSRWRASWRGSLSAAKAQPRNGVPVTVVPGNDAVGMLAEHRGLARWARTALTLALETPDDKVGWRRPALHAALAWAEEQRPHVLYSTGPPHSVHLLAMALQRRLRLPLVMDLRDPWARSPVRIRESGPWRRRRLQQLERTCMRAADAVILNTERLGAEFTAYYGAPCDEKFTVIPNGYDPQLRDEVESLLAATKEDGPTGAVRLCHPGSIYAGRDARPLVDALALLRDRGHRLEFHQVGPCEGAEALREHARLHGLEDQVRVEGRVDHRTILRRMAAADAFVIIQPGTDVQVPCKLYEMLVFRKPILALTGLGAAADVVQRYGLGAVAPPDRPEEIAAALEPLVSALSGSRQPPANEFSAALHAFDGRALTGRLAEVLNQVCAADPYRLPT